MTGHLFDELRILFLTILLSCGSNVQKQVLIIGDSISEGYTPYVSVQNATVQHIPDNASGSDYGVNKIDSWLGSTQWDLVTFNFGLHDFRVSKTNPLLNIQIPDYKNNLRIIGNKIKTHSNKVIWFTTTDVPLNDPSIYSMDLPPMYDKAAREVMVELQIPVFDLLKESQKITCYHIDSALQNNVHFTDEGYKILADFVSQSIQVSL